MPRAVWRAYTRGDYFIYDTTSTSPEGKLISWVRCTGLDHDVATFSPDGSRVALGA